MMDSGLKMKLIILTILLGVASVAHAKTTHTCYNCHDQATFSKKFVHAPVAKQRCDQCHNPHLARYAGLVHQQDEKLCAKCHQTLITQIEQQPFAHQPAQEGQCNKCHDPHSSQKTHLLKDNMHELCFSCHTTLQTEQKFQHAPFAKGNCAACHSAHSSDKPMLLRQQASKMCLSCHANTGGLRSKHLNRDLSKVDCLECHQPHQAENKALLRAIQHKPFQQGKCQTCHGNNGKKNDTDLCISCHQDIMTSFNQQFNHITPGNSGSFCFNCHTPHASQQAGLVRGYPGEACRSCHAGKFERRSGSLHLHPQASNCVNCHQLHGSAMPAMPKGDKQQNGDHSCIGCHENHSNFSHPTGDKAHDPRNGKAMNCSSCHDPCNGTQFKYNLRGTSDKGLCVKCHAGY